MDELCKVQIVQESKKEEIYRIMMANVVHLHQVGKHNHLPIIRSMKEIADRKIRKSISMEGYQNLQVKFNMKSNKVFHF